MLSGESDTRDIEVIVDWESGSRKNEALRKVPSRIAYASENPSLKEDAIGYQVEPEMKSYTWFKLLLDDGALEQKQDDPHLRSSIGDGLMRLPANKTAQDITTNYLTILYKHVIKTLEKKLTASMLDQTPIELWLTSPANWSHEANQATRDAAISAGIGCRKSDKILMIGEPEAAAMAAIAGSIEKYGGCSPYKVIFPAHWADIQLN